MKKEFKKLEISKTRDIQLFEAENGLRVLLYGYEFGKSELFVKMPNEQHFTEISGGYNSASGNMKSGKGSDPWREKFENSYEFYIKGEDMMLKINTFNFYFLKIVAQHGERLKAIEEYKLNAILADYDYLALPADVMTISTVHKLGDTYFVMYHPRYHFSYNNHILCKVKGTDVEMFKVTKFERYRDGGTTIIEALDENDKLHEFYHPTSFKPELPATYNGIAMEEIKEADIIKHLVTILKIEVND